MIHPDISTLIVIHAYYCIVIGSELVGKLCIHIIQNIRNAKCQLDATSAMKIARLHGDRQSQQPVRRERESKSMREFKPEKNQE